ncbi:unnamed protein product [Rotaria magnacalcarata]|uniref:Uncharacterized protein n=2 Tax=Rotaria magnacalcarata TaxID=392030 RepID=A0A819TIV9_9BILA|nr:unnamed protein product [Rotaria magnacalcarata]
MVFRFNSPKFQNMKTQIEQYGPYTTIDGYFTTIFRMASSSTPSFADFSRLLPDNLLNIEQQPPLDISTVLAPYKMHFHAE